MSDPVITEDEKDALLDGVTNGEIEVQSFDGPRYASVSDFEIPDRSRIVTNSFPRLQKLNHRLANRLGKLTDQLLGTETEISSRAVETCQYGLFCERINDLTLIVEFAAKPLRGSALLYLHGDLVRQVVESFYGGSENEPADHAADNFTPGECSVASLFAKDLMATLAEVWQPLIETEHEQIALHLGTDIIDGFDMSDPVICAEFELCFSGRQQPFQIVWPTLMLAPLLPVFEGQKRERDAAEDARWQEAIRSRITDSVVSITSRVGDKQSTLGVVAELSPGDIISIDDPRNSTVFVEKVPILEGRFGVHAGRYAIEATDWLESDTAGTTPSLAR